MSKTLIAPIERVKLLMQNQGELLKQQRITRPYAGVRDVISRVVESEGAIALWRGNWCGLLLPRPCPARSGRHSTDGMPPPHAGPTSSATSPHKP